MALLSGNIELATPWIPHRTSTFHDITDAHWVALSGNKELCKWFQKHIGDTHRCAQYGLLVGAAAAGHIPLLEEYKEFDIYDEIFKTAIKWGKIEVLEWLVENGGIMHCVGSVWEWHVYV